MKNYLTLNLFTSFYLVFCRALLKDCQMSFDKLNPLTEQMNNIKNSIYPMRGEMFELQIPLDSSPIKRCANYFTVITLAFTAWKIIDLMRPFTLN